MNPWTTAIAAARVVSLSAGLALCLQACGGPTSTSPTSRALPVVAKGSPEPKNGLPTDPTSTAAPGGSAGACPSETKPLLPVVAKGGRDERPVGAACAFSSQCASGLCTATGGACGICAQEKATGAPCGGPFDRCEWSSTCVQGVCRSTKRGLGEACVIQVKRVSYDCDARLVCRDIPGTHASVCQRRSPIGAPCDRLSHQSECVAGATCQDGVCAPLRGPGARGERCGTRGDCARGLYCRESDTTCQIPTLVGCGADCSDSAGSVCAAGTHCSVLAPYTCELDAREGASCKQSTCADGLFCAEDVCRRSLELGERCTDLAACRPGLECRDEICVPECR